MRIAVNTRFLLNGKMEGFGWFTYETVKRMVERHPEHQFIFFFDRPYNKKFIFADNVEAHILKPQARHPILFRIWFNISVTKTLKKTNADVFFSPDGYLSLKTNVPQVGVIHDLNFEHYPEDLPRKFRKYLKKYTPQFAKKAKHIITVSQYSKDDIASTYGIDPEKITVAHNGGSDLYKPISDEEKRTVRAKLSDGKEYFIYVGALHARKNVGRLIKAYDQFRRETDSSTKLVIVGEKLWPDSSFEDTYNSLQYKDDIIFTGHLSIDELTKYVAAAKTLTLVSYFEGFGIPLVEAMQCGVPVICGDKTALPEVAGDAGIHVNPFSEQEISSALKKMDTDTELHDDLSKKALERAKEFSWDKTAEIIWGVIEKVTQYP